MEYEKTNSVLLSGRVSKEPSYSHELLGGERFFEFTMDIARLSGNVDSVPVTISERLLKACKLDLSVGAGVDIAGEFRSHNMEDGGRSKLVLSVLCKDITEKSSEQDVNAIELVGYICKPPVYRETPFKRQINDILLAVQRPFFKKSDYIPVIAWGRNASYAANFHVGDKIAIKGRVQSRKFNKVIEGETLEKTAYEVSVQEITNHEERVDSHVSFTESALSLN